MNYFILNEYKCVLNRFIVQWFRSFHMQCHQNENNPRIIISEITTFFYVHLFLPFVSDRCRNNLCLLFSIYHGYSLFSIPLFGFSVFEKSNVFLFIIIFGFQSDLQFKMTKNGNLQNTKWIQWSGMASHNNFMRRIIYWISFKHSIGCFQICFASLY